MSHINKRRLPKVPFTPCTKLWSSQSPEISIENGMKIKTDTYNITVLKQKPKKCIACCLAMIGGKTQDYVNDMIGIPAHESKSIAAKLERKKEKTNKKASIAAKDLGPVATPVTIPITTTDIITMPVTITDIITMPVTITDIITMPVPITDIITMPITTTIPINTTDIITMPVPITTTDIITTTIPITDTDIDTAPVTTTDLLHTNFVSKEDEYSWSCGLNQFGMKLAYCHTEPVALAHYVPELITLDDVFLVTLYTDKVNKITAPLDVKGSNGGSHTIVVCGSKIYDPAGIIYELAESHHKTFMTKRIMRVVPLAYARGL